jgi:hypothetical protein
VACGTLTAAEEDAFACLRIARDHGRGFGWAEPSYVPHQCVYFGCGQWKGRHLGLAFAYDVCDAAVRHTAELGGINQRWPPIRSPRIRAMAQSAGSFE